MPGSAPRYSTKGLLADLRFGMFIATCLTMIAFVSFALAAMANLAGGTGHAGAAIPWSAFGLLVVAVPGAYYLAAVSASILAFSMRPLRRGQFGNALCGFLGGFCGIGAMGMAWNVFPVQFSYLTRNPSPTPAPMGAGFVLIMAFFVGAAGAAVGLYQHSRGSNG